MLLKGVQLFQSDPAAHAAATAQEPQHKNGGAEQNPLAVEDRLDISEEGRKRAMQAPQLGEGEQKAGSAKSRLEFIEQRIKEIQEEIQEVQTSDLPDKQKQQRIQALNQELMQLNHERSKLQSAGGVQYLGGTPAQGFDKSLT